MKKKQKVEKDINEKMLQRMFDKFFPNVFSILPKWQDKFENIDYSQPQTFMKSIENDIETSMKPLTGFKIELLIRFVRRFLLKSSFIKNEFIKIPDQMAKLVKSMAKQDSRYSLLLELVSEADKKYPLSSLIIAFRHGDIRKTFSVNCSPMPYLLEVEKTQGEKRAFYVYEAMRHICEHIYQPYLKTIWQLAYLRDGRLPPDNEPSYGNMVKVCLENLPPKYHKLIEPSVSIMRNAPSHNPLNWVYETDTIVLKDKEKQIEMPVNELIQKLESMLQISSLTISRVGQLYMFRIFSKNGFMENLFDLLPEFLSNDKGRIQSAEKVFNNFIENWLKSFGVEINKSLSVN